MIDLDDYPLVPGPSESYLAKRQLIDYESERRNCLRWLLTKGKDPRQRVGYADGTVRPRSYRMDRFYRFVWIDLGEGYLTNLTKATVFGAASSGCSFGAVAIGKGLFKKGAHTVNFFAFMFASTNLIVELGLMILILLGWEFLVAELLGGIILIAVPLYIVYALLDRGFSGNDEQSLSVLRERYARGELTDDEFDRRRKQLERTG